MSEAAAAAPPEPPSSSARAAPIRHDELSRAARLVGVSCLCLFLEMALIRFINSTVQVIAYFNNFVILATFLGLGFGALCAQRWPRLFGSAPILLFGVVAGLVGLDRYAWTSTQQPDLVAWIADTGHSLVLPSGVMVSLIFAACFAVFVPLGCELGHCIDSFRDRLQAYGFDILGSISGVLMFAVASWGRYPPWSWFLIAGAAIGALSWSSGFGLKWRARCCC